MPVDLIVVLIIILVVVLIWRGPKTLPQIGEALGRGVKEARKEATDIQADLSKKQDQPGGDDQDRPAGS
ncbi:MAG TPA: twin-arginine translocase TatA/TatE family subunit [Candidatus Limnocylindrales bacterium]|nr:twin-arginine translocase TatA/TatE family subunit [Candidatus Limnocylindrales bacterium]